MGKKDSILIVDDDESTCKSLALIFGKEHYDIQTAGTGREAIEKVRGRPFNLALLDIKLPDLEGVELLAPLKEMRPDMVIIMVTGYASVDNTVRALNQGASAYIIKPLDMNQVLIMVREVLAKQRMVMENRRLYEVAQRELAERKRAEERLNHLSTFLHSIRKVNQLIIRENDVARLLQGACDNFAKTRGYHNAWIVLFDEH